ncbi:MAG TPA: chemotaxis protein CheW [Thermoanaerobaculia bacterium]|nr:chemotaxis protein CheW [Thermoanaerobaculia bacterium]
MADAPYLGLTADFYSEANERCDRLEEYLLAALEQTGDACDELLNTAKRELHTLKGNAGMMGFRELQEAAHRLEDRVASVDREDPEIEGLLLDLDNFRGKLRDSDKSNYDQAEALTTSAAGQHADSVRCVRVPFTALDELVDLLAEMVIFRNRVDDALIRSRSGGKGAWDDVATAHEALGKTLTFIQDRIMSIRMVPLQILFGQLRRIVHDESLGSGKRVRFTVTGGETPMDKALLECASEALGHIVRNSIVHGIETPATRTACQKPAEGNVRLTAVAHANEVVVEVIDDGAGIDRAEIIRAAEARGIDPRSVDDPFELLFRAGFSTRRETDLSAGRGVGLSAAVDAVRRLGGHVSVSSEPGVGTMFRMRLPLTVSITRALLVHVDGDDYAIPLAAISESVRIKAGDRHVINQSSVFEWRGSVLPLLDLGCVMDSAGAPRDDGYIVVIEADNRHRGLLVDDLTGMREIVVKGLGEVGGLPPGISGATILGDGRVLLILDPRSLVAMTTAIDPRLVASDRR